MPDDIEPVTPAKRLSGAVARWLWRGLLAWLALGAVGAAFRWSELVGSWATPKIAVPVVVIESDDWPRRYIVNDDGRDIVKYDARMASAVDRLAQMLERHCDSVGRHPVVSAFVVVGLPDIEKTAADPDGRYHWKPMDGDFPMLVAALKRASARGVFELAYHGRDHFDCGLAVKQIKREAEEARAAGRDFDPTTLPIFAPLGSPRYIASERDQGVAEYFDSRDAPLAPLDQHAIHTKTGEGLREFERMFGHRHPSTVAPGYFYGPGAEQGWRAHGIRFVHGVNLQQYPGLEPGKKQLRAFGCRTEGSLVGIPRNVFLESHFRDRDLPSVEEAIEAATTAIRLSQPAVICTHSWNYFIQENRRGPETVEEMFVCLDSLLGALERKHAGLRYLSIQEAGHLAETGRVTLSGAGKTPEVVAADGMTHAWLSAWHLYDTRAKLRIWMWVLVAWGLALTIAVAARPAGLLRQYLRKHTRS